LVSIVYFHSNKPNSGEALENMTNSWTLQSNSLATLKSQSFALAIQRKSHILNDTIYPIEHRKNAFRRPLWLAGFSSYLIANIIGSIFTIGYLPIVILAPIGAMGLVFNAIFAKLVLGDPFTRKSIAGKIYFSLFSVHASQVKLTWRNFLKEALKVRV
jgi:drug/metabolite transporter (DMT)-like permease